MTPSRLNLERVRRRPASALVFSAALALFAPGAAQAEPSLEETIAFTRSELARLCDDTSESGIDVLDHLRIGGDRSCLVVLTAGRLSFSIRERGSEYSGRGYARMRLDVRFSENSGFLCGRPGNDGFASLFFTCDASQGARGRACAKRDVSVDHPDRDPFQTHQTLGAAAIMRTDPTNCGVLARALTFIGERTKASPDQEVRDFFSEK